MRKAEVRTLAQLATGYDACIEGQSVQSFLFLITNGLRPCLITAPSARRNRNEQINELPASKHVQVHRINELNPCVRKTQEVHVLVLLRSSDLHSLHDGERSHEQRRSLQRGKNVPWRTNSERPCRLLREFQSQLRTCSVKTSRLVNGSA
jgi:hypothetical protein